MMYLGNEIERQRQSLSYCLYESNWIEQTQLSKNYVVILAEVLRQPKQLIIAKLYPLNLKTFTAVRFIFNVILCRILIKIHTL